MIADDMGDVLRAYYQWARVNDPSDLAYPHIEPVRRLLGGGIGCEGLSDDEALWIDRCLNQLKICNPRAYWVIYWVYAEGRTMRRLECNKRICRKTLARLALEGREFIRGALYGFAECA